MEYQQLVGNEDNKYVNKTTIFYDVQINKVPISRGDANRAFWPLFDDVMKGKFVIFPDGITVLTTLTTRGLYGLGQHPLRMVNSKTGRVVNVDLMASTLCVSHDLKRLAYTQLHVMHYHIHLAEIEVQ